MGWSVVFVAFSVLTKIPLNGIVLLLSGGLCYTGGIVFFAMKKPRYMHSVWHLFVLAGSILQYFAFLFYALPV
jgi:hemolysin III